MSTPIEAAASELLDYALRLADRMLGKGAKAEVGALDGARRVVAAYLRAEFDERASEERRGGYLLTLADLIVELEAAE